MRVSRVCLLGFLACASLAGGHEVTISNKDASGEVCSGMWASANTHIHGALATLPLLQGRRPNLFIPQSRSTPKVLGG